MRRKAARMVNRNADKGRLSGKLMRTKRPKIIEQLAWAHRLESIIGLKVRKASSRAHTLQAKMAQGVG